MHSESDYFSEVEEISDISQIMIPHMAYDLERCIKFAADSNNI